MNKRFFIWIGIIILVFYLTSSVPYCVPWTGENKSVEIQTTEDIADIISHKLILLHVIGNSMFPTIKDDSKCLCVREEDYSVMDIIAFVNDEGQSISHRIISIDSERIFTQGDNNNFIDPPTKKENIICKIPEVPKYATLINNLN